MQKIHFLFLKKCKNTSSAQLCLVDWPRDVVPAEKEGVDNVDGRHLSLALSLSPSQRGPSQLVLLTRRERNVGNMREALS